LNFEENECATQNREGSLDQSDNNKDIDLDDEVDSNTEDIVLKKESRPNLPKLSCSNNKDNA
jgi:hypothetical protein